MLGSVVATTRTVGVPMHFRNPPYIPLTLKRASCDVLSHLLCAGPGKATAQCGGAGRLSERGSSGAGRERRGGRTGAPPLPSRAAERRPPEVTVSAGRSQAARTAANGA